VFLGILTFVIVILGAISHYRSGIWSAVLTLWSALLAGAVAFGLYLPLSHAWFPMGDLGSAVHYWGDGLMLLLLFVVVFGILRVLADQLLRNAMTFQAIIDSAGGAVIGAAAGYVVGGVLAVFAQMMPLAPTSVLGYGPFDLKSGKRVGHLFTRADDVVLGLYNGILGGALAGQDGDLAAVYPAPGPATGDAAGNARRGRGVDDILGYYFHRRLEYAIVVNEDLGVFAEKGRRGGVPVKRAKETTYNPGRGSVPTKIRVEKASMVPYGRWVKTWRAVRPAADGKEFAVEWTSQDDDIVKVGAQADYAVLMVDLAFRPATEDAYSLSLSDWELVSGYKSPDGKPMEFPRAKLWGEAKVTQGGAGVDLMPLAAVGTEKQSAMLDDGSVEAEGWHPAKGLGKDADALFLAKAAVWNFGGGTRKAKATLAFLVPSLTMPWQYGVRCGGVALRTGRNVKAKKGLFKGRSETVGPFKMKITDVQRVSQLPGVKKEAAEGRELILVSLDLSKSGKVAMLLTPDDWPLTNVALKEEYAGSLLETIEVKDGEPVAKRSLRNADAKVEGAEPVMNEAGDKGERLSPSWEIYLLDRSAKVAMTLVFEVPRGKPFSQYDFKVADDMEAEPPEWYLLRNVASLRSSTHLVEYEDDEAMDEVPVRLSSGRVTSFRAPAASGSELLVVTVTIAPKKQGDTAYYELKVENISLKAVKGPKAGRVVPIHSLRFADEEAFHRPKADEALTIKGEKNVQIAFYVTKDREEMSLTVKGFKAIKLD